MKFIIRRKASQLVNPHDAICVGEDGKDYMIDIFVDGGIEYQDIDGLIGREFECDYIHTFCYIAHNVKLLDEVMRNKNDI